MTKKILMIDDDKEMCLELSEILRDCGYDVQTAFDGITGLALLGREPFDVLLLDIKMPGMSGLEVLLRLKENGAPVKVIVLSGRPFVHNLSATSAEKDESTRLLRLANSIITKPFDVKEVLQRIDAMMKGE